MIESPTLKDLELISAYLDGACSLKDRRKVDDRLQSEPEFAQVVREYEHVRRLLKALPLKRAPRNFTLSASQVPAKPQRFFLVPTLNFVAMAAAFTVVVVFVGSNFFPGLFARPMAARSMAVSESAESAPMIVTWGQQSELMAKGGGMETGAAPSASTMDSSTYSADNSLPSATQEAMQPMLAQAPSGSATEEPANPILGIAPTEDQGEMITTVAAPQPASPLASLHFNWLELAFAALAVFSAIVAFIIKKLR